MFNSALSATRVSARSVVAARSLHSTPAAHKTMAEKTAEVADALNKSLGKGLASAIETGEKATEATKQTLGAASKESKEKGAEIADAAGQRADQTAAQARQTSQDLKKEARH